MGWRLSIELLGMIVVRFAPMKSWLLRCDSNTLLLVLIGPFPLLSDSPLSCLDLLLARCGGSNSRDAKLLLNLLPAPVLPAGASGS